MEITSFCSKYQLHESKRLATLASFMNYIFTSFKIKLLWYQLEINVSIYHALLEVTNILFSTSANYDRTVLMHTSYKTALTYQ